MLTNNPFYILDVPLSANRQIIASEADEQSLILGAEACESILATLTNPAKRLRAELDWFPGTDEALIRMIRDAAGSGTGISSAAFGGLSSIGKINAAVYNLELALSHGEMSGDDAAEAVTEIDRMIIDCSMEDLQRDINAGRAEAGITPAELSGIKDAWVEKKEQTADRIADELANIDREEYVDFANRLAEKISGGSFSELFLALIDRYEIDMQPFLTEQTAAFKKSMNRLAWRAVFLFNVKNRVTGFLLDLGEWFRLVRPMVTAAKARGTENAFVTETALGIRELTKVVIKQQDYPSVCKIDSELVRMFSDVPSVRETYQNELDHVKLWMGKRAPKSI